MTSTMRIDSTKGTTNVKTAEQARAWFDTMQPSYADLDGIEIAASFTGTGHYWLSDGDASMDLGECADLGDLAYAVAQCIQAGDADWSDWKVSKG